MQSYQNSPKTDTFHEPTAYEPHVKTSFEKIIIYARHEHGVFNIKMISFTQKLKPLEKCQFSKCFHLIALHCTK